VRGTDFERRGESFAVLPPGDRVSMMPDTFTAQVPPFASMGASGRWLTSIICR